ncbi:MAG: GNAT family N-acetyltransferase [Bacteroidales bacterium]|nr:GNAT family N-acetyltransferase [Bacteroidales bacterium]
MKNQSNEPDKQILIAELSKTELLRKTNFGGNELYIFTANEAPNLMKEVGRLREMTFRHAGGGTGKEYDIDDYDTSETPYTQMIVWEPEQQIVLGGYRYIDGATVTIKNPNDIKLATQDLFKFSDNFINNFLPNTLELGRSFVRVDYQSTKSARKAIFALDNLWDGLGALIIKMPHMKYMSGKVTMYDNYNKNARDILLYFLKKIFPDNENLVYPLKALEAEMPIEELEKLFNFDNYKENYKELSKLIRSYGEKIPPLINSYMNLSSSMRTFGTAINDHFGGVEETGILITVADIHEDKTERHINSL